MTSTLQRPFGGCKRSDGFAGTRLQPSPLSRGSPPLAPAKLGGNRCEVRQGAAPPSTRARQRALMK